MAGSSTEIGSAAVVLTATADGLVAGLDKAAADTRAFAGKTTAALTGAFAGKGLLAGIGKLSGSIAGAFQDKGILGGLQHIGGAVTTQLAGVAGAAKGLLTTAGTAIGTALGGPIGGAIGSVVGSAVGDLGATVAGALASPFDKIDQFAKLTKRAGVLGIDASQYQGLTKVLERAGIEGQMADTVFAKLGNTITKAEHGDPGAATTFERLGLDAQKLAGQSLDKSFLEIATAISQIDSPAQQAHAAFAAFGKAGAQLLPELQKGGKGIQEFIDQQKKMGAVLSDSQLQAAADASKAWKGAKNAIGAAWDGLKNRATLIAAPVIEFAGKAVSKAFALATPVFDWLGRAVGQVADLAGAVFDQLGTWFDQGIAAVKEWAAELGGFTGEWPTVQEVVVRVFRAVGTAAAVAWDTVKLGGGTIATVAGFMIEHGGGILSVFRTLVDLLKTLPETAKPSWLNGFIEGVDRADDKVRGFGRTLKTWGATAVTSWGQSARTFNDWLDNALRPKKAKALDPMRPLAEGGAPVAKRPDVWNPAKLAGAVEAGTKEAYTITAKARYGSYGPPEDAVKQNGKKIDKTNDLLQQLNQRMGALEGSVGEI